MVFSRAWKRSWGTNWADQEEVQYSAKVSVWIRWFIIAACGFTLVNQTSGYASTTSAILILVLLLMAALNGYMQYRLAANRSVTWRWMLAWSWIDAVLITLAVAQAGGFSHFSQYLMYYPALAVFAVVFTSFPLNLTWVTMVAAAYAGICLLWGEGIDLESGDGTTLFCRIVVMYAVVVVVNLVSRFERTRRREALERERALEEERIEFSRAIHDTAAQSAYLIGLGIETAMAMVERSNREVLDSLRTTLAISKSAMWELRHPIDVGLIYQGMPLGAVLSAHADRFTRITSIPAEVIRSGREPPLSPATMSLLFSITHNAMTNASLHAAARKVVIALDFGQDALRLSVTDDGVGLPDDYAQRGHGFRNMEAAAQRVGGTLEVKAGEQGRGTTVSCLIPQS